MFRELPFCWISIMAITILHAGEGEKQNRSWKMYFIKRTTTEQNNSKNPKQTKLPPIQTTAAPTRLNKKTPYPPNKQKTPGSCLTSEETDLTSAQKIHLKQFLFWFLCLFHYCFLILLLMGEAEPGFLCECMKLLLLQLSTLSFVFTLPTAFLCSSTFKCFLLLLCKISFNTDWHSLYCLFKDWLLSGSIACSSGNCFYCL